MHLNCILLKCRCLTALFLCVSQWQAEAQEYCPSAKLVLVGCKLDMRTDVSTLRELSKQRLIPVTHEQVRRHMHSREMKRKQCGDCAMRRKKANYRF